jgi:hypothetical protein
MMNIVYQTCKQEHALDRMHFHVVKMYKDKEVKKNVKNMFLSMCDVKVFLTFTFTEYGN